MPKFIVKQVVVNYYYQKVEAATPGAALSKAEDNPEHGWLVGQHKDELFSVEKLP